MWQKRTKVAVSVHERRGWEITVFERQSGNMKTVIMKTTQTSHGHKLLYISLATGDHNNKSSHQTGKTPTTYHDRNSCPLSQMFWLFTLSKVTERAFCARTTATNKQLANRKQHNHKQKYRTNKQLLVRKFVVSSVVIKTRKLEKSCHVV